MPHPPYFDGGFSAPELKELNREPFDTATPAKVLCTCGYWRAARLSHAADCPANVEPQP